MSRKNFCFSDEIKSILRYKGANSVTSYDAAILYITFLFTLFKFTFYSLSRNSNNRTRKFSIMHD